MDTEGKNYLSRRDFFAALRLVSIAQNITTELTEDSIEQHTDVPLPQFNILTSNEKAKYVSVFESSKRNSEGYLEGKEAVALFQKSGLARSTLHEIWAMADVDQDGQLNQEEFIIAMHLIVCMSKRGMQNLPEKVPV